MEHNLHANGYASHITHADNPEAVRTLSIKTDYVDFPLIGLSAYAQVEKLVLSINRNYDTKHLMETLRSLPSQHLKSLHIQCATHRDIAQILELLRPSESLALTVWANYPAQGETDPIGFLDALLENRTLRSLKINTQYTSLSTTILFSHPERIAQLDQLEEFEFEPHVDESVKPSKHNRMAEMIREFVRLPRLRKLSLGIRAVVAEWKSWHFSPSIEHLWLWNLPAKFEGVDLRHLVNLQTFNAIIGFGLAGKNWGFPNEQLPPSVRSIRFEGNDESPIEIVPERFPNLQKLHLDNNRLQHLPKGVDKLPALRQLYLANNRIDTVPDALLTMPLDELDLASNPLHNDTEKLCLLSVLPVGNDPAPTRYHTIQGWTASFRPLCYYFFNQVFPNYEPAKRLQIFRILSGTASETDALLSLDDVLSLLRIDIPLAVYSNFFISYLERHFVPKDPQLSSGASLYFLGKPTTAKSKWTELLQPVGAKIAKTPSTALAAIVVCNKPEADFDWPKGVAVFTENTLRTCVERVEMPFLKQADFKENLSHIEQLLRSRDVSNLQIALEMLESGGVPPELITVLYFTYRQNRSPFTALQKRKASKLLRTYAPESLKNLNWKNAMPPNAQTVVIHEQLPQHGLNLEKFLEYLFEEAFGDGDVASWEVESWLYYIPTPETRKMIGRLLAPRMGGWLSLTYTPDLSFLDDAPGCVLRAQFTAPQLATFSPAHPSLSKLEEVHLRLHTPKEQQELVALPTPPPHLFSQVKRLNIHLATADWGLYLRRIFEWFPNATRAEISLETGSYETMLQATENRLFGWKWNANKKHFAR